MPSYRTSWGASAADGLAALLPAGVAVVEAVGAVDPDPLFAEESEEIAGAIDRRRREFALGRSCARRALALCGLPPSAIPSREREPIWPRGVAGSITHCRGYCAAAVTATGRWSGVGIDAETFQLLNPGVAQLISVGDEPRHLEALGPRWESVLFSAKEAIFKAWFPSTRRWLEFRDVELRIAPGEGRFEARLLIEDSRRMEGRFALEGDRVLTAVML